MSIRRTVRDYAGCELYPGDLINYGTRQGNRVRMTDAVILDVYTVNLAGRLHPMLKVQPTGTDSGFVPRRTLRVEEVSAEHVRLIEAGYVKGEGQ